jgi:hypothetical protein
MAPLLQGTPSPSKSLKPWLVLLTYAAAITVPLWVAAMRNDDSFIDSYMRIFVTSLTAYFFLCTASLVFRFPAIANFLTLLFIVAMTAQVVGGLLYFFGISAVFKLGSKLPNIMETVLGWIASGIIGNFAYAILKRRFRFFREGPPAG